MISDNNSISVDLPCPCPCPYLVHHYYPSLLIQQCPLKQRCLPSSHSPLNTIAPISDDPHLEVTVTPSSSAFYAGETFSVTITFRNTRIPHPSTTPLGHHDNENIHITPSTAATEVGTATSSFRGMPPPPDPRVIPGPDLPRRKNRIGTYESRIPIFTRCKSYFKSRMAEGWGNGHSESRDLEEESGFGIG
jgi:hypothetical protein